MPDASEIDRLVAAVKAGSKYARLDDALVRRVAAQEAEHRADAKRTVKAVRNRLHQVTAAFAGDVRYERWLRDLRAAKAASDEPAFLACCRRALRTHASTREREPVVESFYQRVFAELGPVHTVLDVACGLNPLCAPWMPLPPGARYIALDAHCELIDFVRQVLPLCGVDALCACADVLSEAALPRADVALVLKTLPCLEQLERDAGRQLLAALDADRIVVSYPARTLGGRNVGMTATYARQFEALVQPPLRVLSRIDFDTELVYVLSRERV